MEQSMRVKLDDALSATIERERSRLLNFIRGRVSDRTEAEDILQDVFREYVEAYRMVEPIQNAGAWMFQVARNRITDWFRKKRPVVFSDIVTPGKSEDRTSWEEMLPSPAAGPDAAYARGVLVDELLSAIDELPPHQREAFVAHEIEGRSFNEIAQETGEKTGTLISRKHQAVLHLRRRLQNVYDEFTHR